VGLGVRVSRETVSALWLRRREAWSLASIGRTTGCHPLGRERGAAAAPRERRPTHRNLDPFRGI